MVRSLVLERDRETQRAAEQQRRAEEQHRRAEESKQQAEDLRGQMLRLQLELERFRKWYYGPRADRLQSSGDVAQMLLAFAEELNRKPVHPDDAPSTTEAADEPRCVRRRKGRRNLADFENFPVTTHVHELSAEERACPCCGAERKEIGADESWQIEHYPARFERIRHLRTKYACPTCESKGSGAQIQTAAKPECAIEKGLAGPGLLAYIVTSKFSDYLPLYRLEDIFERQGFEISRATQSVWCGDVADLVEPLYRLMAERVRASHLVATDDTIMPMLAKGKTANARMWVYAGDEAGPYNIFDFTLNRGRDGPKYFLKDYRQVLLADAYGGYNGVVAGNEITRAGCWAHARRKIVDAEKTAPDIAREAIELLRALYSVEHRGKNLSAAARLELRRADSAPVLADLKEKFLGWKQQLLPKHPMAEAVNYALGQWAELTVFCSDGAVPIDNNVSEREMKRVVLNRKNSLFVGNARGGRTAAILASLTSSCRRHGVDPQRYLTQLLVNLPATRLSDLPAWLPDEWKRRQTAPASPTPA
ncbi:MAG: IS66 family transposase [Acidobacteriales bacterium]|nr:IS66 family transposase [Terriglobales bacterium]